MKNAELTVLIMAYDSYSDVWNNFEYFFKKNWPDCEYTVAMGTCTDETGISICDKVIPAGDGLEWTQRLHKILYSIDSPYILIILEDLYIDKPVDSVHISDCLNLMKENKEIGHIRLNPDTRSKSNYEKNPNFGEYVEGQAYRISTQPAIWRKEYLLKMTEQAMSGWDFEYIGSVNSCDFPEKCLYTKNSVISFTNSIWRSKWTTEGVRLCKKNNLEMDFNRRAHYTFLENIGVKTKTTLYHILGENLSTKLVMKYKKIKR